MFKQEAKELLPIIQAFAEGKEVEFSFNGIDSCVDVGNNPSCEYHTDQYRIKPEEEKTLFEIYKDAYKNGKSFQCKNIYGGQWVDCEFPVFLKNDMTYRIKPEVDPYEKLKEALKNGKTIQYLFEGDKWIDMITYSPSFDGDISLYRIKPEEDPYKELKEAFKNGRNIQYRKSDYNSWDDCRVPMWLSDCEYRIKPEPKLVPFTFEDNKMFRDKWLQDKGGGKQRFKIIEFDEYNLYYEHHYIISYGDFLETFEFEDGNSCGKYITE